ncbi:MAG: hypothetical protein C5B53_12930 [Candidatus Melainabacteria bacterium]|nr:MAG: hypothetical protein C5B53_12930 [Candidatus Melainabacteria bacterium]
MTYELYFRTRQVDRKISVDQFADYWRSRPGGEVCEDEPCEAGYSSEATGGGFGITYYDESKLTWLPGTTETEKEEARKFASLEMNYFFGQEQYEKIAEEVAAFVKHFDLIVSDPQTEWGVYSEYDPQKTFRITQQVNEEFKNAIDEGRIIPLVGECLRKSKSSSWLDQLRARFFR